MDLKRVQRSLEALEDEIVEVVVEGDDAPMLMHVADAEELEWAALMASPGGLGAAGQRPAARGLRGPLALRRRRRAALRRSTQAGNAAPTVIVDGRVVAVWDVLPRTTKADALEVASSPLPRSSGDAAEVLEQQVASPRPAARRPRRAPPLSIVGHASAHRAHARAALRSPAPLGHTEDPRPGWVAGGLLVTTHLAVRTTPVEPVVTCCLPNIVPTLSRPMSRSMRS